METTHAIDTMENEIAPAKRRHGKSGRRFTKFERELISTFERTQGYEACRLAIAVIRGEIEPWDVPEKAAKLGQEWVKVSMPASFNRVRARWEILDQLLGTFGVESLSKYRDESYRGPEIDYLNAGDTYTATLVYDYSRAYPWRIACWGDYAERYCRFED